MHLYSFLNLITLAKYQNSLIGFFLICFSILFSKCNVPCYTATANIGFISFQDSETNTIILRRYSKATNFATLVDTFLINKSNSSYDKLNDTLQVFNNYGGDQGLKSKYDYEVYLPQSNRLFQISEIAEWFMMQKASIAMDQLYHCIDPIVSYKLNGQLISGNSDYSTFYIKK